MNPTRYPPVAPISVLRATGPFGEHRQPGRSDEDVEEHREGAARRPQRRADEQDRSGLQRVRDRRPGDGEGELRRDRGERGPADDERDVPNAAA